VNLESKPIEVWTASESATCYGVNLAFAGVGLCGFLEGRGLMLSPDSDSDTDSDTGSLVFGSNRWELVAGTRKIRRQFRRLRLRWADLPAASVGSLSKCCSALIRV
jgi:hypothetical protein